MNWVGIDPGQTGGIALLSKQGLLLDVLPMPVDGTEVAAGQLRQIIDHWRSLGEMKVMIEQVHSMPRQGVSSTFKFGKSFGIALGVVGALGIPMHRVTPQNWKKEMGLTGKDKDASRHLATELWPDMQQHWKLKKQDGKAEAALIAEYARRTL